jgi:hypothetical protein
MTGRGHSHHVSIHACHVDVCGWMRVQMDGPIRLVLKQKHILSKPGKKAFHNAFINQHIMFRR